MLRCVQSRVLGLALASSVLAGSSLAVAPLASAPLGAQQPAAPPSPAPPPRLDAVMSPGERTATGVARLTAGERRALEAWLARYTEVVAAGAAAGARGGDPGARRTLQPAHDERVGSRMAGRRSGRPARGAAARPTVLRDLARVERVIDGGSFLLLHDGSMWEVWLPDRPSSDEWRAGDDLRVARAAAPPREGFIETLTNARTGRTVSVRFAGRVRIGR